MSELAMKYPCNCTALRKATRKISTYYDACLAPVGLKLSQYALLAELDRVGDGVAMNTLAALAVMDRSTLGQGLRYLETAGLVTTTTAEDDLRRKEVAFTPLGREKFAEAQKLWRVAQDRFETVFGAQESVDLRDTLLRLASGPLIDNATWPIPA